MPQDERQDQPLDVVPSATTLEAPGVTGMDGFAPPLGDMSAEEFRRYGRSLVDWIAEYFERVERTPRPRPGRAGRAHREAPCRAARSR